MQRWAPSVGKSAAAGAVGPVVVQAAEQAPVSTGCFSGSAAVADWAQAQDFRFWELSAQVRSWA